MREGFCKKAKRQTKTFVIISAQTRPSNKMSDLFSPADFILTHNRSSPRHNSSNHRCINQTSFPTTYEFYESLGGYAIALYALAGFVSTLSIFLYLRLLYRHVHEVPPSRLCATLWINSIYPVVAISATFGIAFPQSSRYIALFYKLYLGLAMRYFVKLTLAWYGGMKGMLENFDEEAEVCMGPCSLCNVCSRKVRLTR